MRVHFPRMSFWTPNARRPAWRAAFQGTCRDFLPALGFGARNDGFRKRIAGRRTRITTQAEIFEIAKRLMEKSSRTISRILTNDVAAPEGADINFSTGLARALTSEAILSHPQGDNHAFLRPIKSNGAAELCGHTPVDQLSFRSLQASPAPR